MNEFALIDRFFRPLDTGRDDVLVGIGDDAALLAPSTKAMAVCTDTLVGGVHFAVADDPFDIGFKSLAVNLSDVAAMGARPSWAMLNLVLPSFDPDWLEGFCRGFSDLASRYGVALIGGDTTRGPLTVSVQAGGMIAPGQVLRRDGARPGHLVFLGAPIGDGWLGLAVAEDRYRPDATDREYLLERLRRPEPQVVQGAALAGVASAAIDVSDGLLADLGHVLAASGDLGASIVLDDRAFSPAARRYLRDGGEPAALASGGDDYVLCFTVDPSRRSECETACENAGFSPIEIGVITAAGNLEAHDGEGHRIAGSSSGYRHFEDD